MLASRSHTLSPYLALTCASQDDIQLLTKIKENKIYVVIGLFGDKGVGKSSFINTVMNVLSHENTSGAKLMESAMSYFSRQGSQQQQELAVAVAPDFHKGNYTKYRESVPLTRYIKIIDNRGWHDWKNVHALRQLRAQICK